MDRLIGKRLRERRLALQVADVEIASTLGVDVVTLNLYESGHERIPAERLFLSCRALSLRPADLFRQAVTQWPVPSGWSGVYVSSWWAGARGLGWPA